MQTNSIIRNLLFGLIGTVLTTTTAPRLQAQAEFRVYKPVAGLSGNLNSIGSDTLNNLMTLWAESFREFYPNVRIQVEGKGSSTAPPALIKGTAQLGPMSRSMKGTEVDEFERAFGYKPTEIKVAIDALAVYVHKDNPVQSISLSQLDGVFSNTFKSGSPNLLKWSDLDPDSTLGSRNISLYGRNSASGTYGFFKQIGLMGGDFKSSVKEQPGSSSVVQAISSDASGIGYSGIGYKTSGVHVLAISKRPGQKAYEPSTENCLSGKYPLARFLYIYVNIKPGGQPDQMTAEFLKFILSKQGQETVVKDGYYSLPPFAAANELKSLEIK